MNSDQRETDYYAILNLPHDCPDEVIHEQYRRMVKLFHPDRNAGDLWCTEQLKLVNAAYSVLSNFEAKKLYDQRRIRRGDFTVSFAEQLAEELVAESSAAEKRRKLGWNFDTDLLPEPRKPDSHPQIAFVTQHAKLVSADADHAVTDAAQLRFYSNGVPDSKVDLFSSTARRVRIAAIVCLSALMLFGSAYIASPTLRTIIRPLLHHEATATYTAHQ